MGVALFLTQRFRLAALIPVIATWGWRACSEWLRADYRGTSRISIYQLMAIVSVIYLGAFVLLMPITVPLMPDLSAGFAQVTSTSVILLLQLVWVALFLYYGRSRVTASTLSFQWRGVVAGSNLGRWIAPEGVRCGSGRALAA